MIPKNIHEAALQVKNDHIKRLENAIRALVENFDVDLLLSRIRQGTTAEELLETERDALRARVARLEEALKAICAWPRPVFAADAWEMKEVARRALEEK